jgi:hypothetical protein
VPNKIRNVRQTAQEREIIKTAPDVVVYIEGLPYLLNPYLNSADGHDFVIVNFNDHVVNFNASYDVDNFIPSGTINLSVPNHQKYLYQSPGGNNVLESMMQVQVFAKGFYLSRAGNSLYHRVFKGLISHVSHTDTGKSIEISIQCLGILHFLERMQMELNPALLTNSERPATPYLSNQHNMDPYQQLADIFLRGITFEGFQLNSLLQQKVKGSDFEQAVSAGYAVKWQSILNGIRKDVHIFGYTFGTVLPQDIDGVAAKTVAQGKEGPDTLAAKNDVVGQQKESDPKRDQFVSVIRGYLPDFGVGSLQLLNGRIVSRMERIRTIVNAIGFEGYQDVNGEIIIKPPLYNLDVTDLGDQNQRYSLHPSTEIYEENNPFVIPLALIENESETEDQAGVRATRMSVQGNWSKTMQFGTDSNTLREVVSHIDIPKLTKFGLREEPARTMPWLVNSDKINLYTFAVSELSRANRGYRTYTFTIPMRPELKLGFPMYIPHRDMYGYIKSISLNYQIGGQASMTVSLDTLRKRPMFPATHKMPNTADQQSGKEKEVTIYTTQPNLVMKWTTPPAKPAQTPSQIVGGLNDLQLQSIQNAAAQSGFTSDNPRSNLLDNPATQLQSSQKPVFQEEVTVVSHRRDQLGTSWSTKADTTSKSFRVQNDSEKFFSKEKWVNGIDVTYCQKILAMQPFTDEKGYEVVTPFPWGRWKDLHTALNETHGGKIVEDANAQDAEVLSGIKTFLFAGLGTPGGSLEPGSALLKALGDLQTSTETDAIFELTYPGKDQPGGDSSVIQTAQPDSNPLSDQYLLNQSDTEVQQRVDLFISGTPQPLSATKADIDLTKELSTPGVTPLKKN